MVTQCERDNKWEAMRMEKHIACPCCNNKRLFDVDESTIGIIKIKCNRCKAVVSVTISNKTIRTEQIGTQS